MLRFLPAIEGMIYEIGIVPFNVRVSPLTRGSDARSDELTHADRFLASPGEVIYRRIEMSIGYEISLLTRGSHAVM